MTDCWNNSRIFQSLLHQNPCSFRRVVNYSVRPRFQRCPKTCCSSLSLISLSNHIFLWNFRSSSRTSWNTTYTSMDLDKLEVYEYNVCNVGLKIRPPRSGKLIFHDVIDHVTAIKLGVLGYVYFTGYPYGTLLRLQNALSFTHTLPSLSVCMQTGQQNLQKWYMRVFVIVFFPKKEY